MATNQLLLIEEWLLIIVAVALVTVVIFVVRLWLFSRSSVAERAARAARRRGKLRSRSNDGTHKRAGISFTTIGLVVVFLALLGGAAYRFIPALQGDQHSGQWVVLVASFNDGADGQTGRVVADELVRALREAAPAGMTVEALGVMAASANEAAGLLTEHQGDLLLWGDIQAGALLDSPSMVPHLFYNSHADTANVWEGYLGRFAMPRNVLLADAPLNGKAVLPPLIHALANYHYGNADAALAVLGQLLTDYPLDAALPRAIRGTILWARGDYQQAAEEYRAALRADDRGPAPSLDSADRALLANNLGAILLDAGDPNALGAMAETVRLLNERDLGQLRMNLGLLALREGRAADATSAFEQARNLLPPNAPLLLSLARAYRESGQLASAATLLKDVAKQIDLDSAIANTDLKTLLRERLQASRDEEQALLALAQAVNGRDSIEWELEVAPPFNQATLNAVEALLRSAINTHEHLGEAWRKRATAAAARSANGGVASGQAQLADLERDRQRYALAVILSEQGRTTNGKRGFFASLLDVVLTRSTPVAEARNLLNDLTSTNPNNFTAHIAYGRLLRQQGDAGQALQHYNQAVAAAPQRPEGYFGQGMVALAGGDRGNARRLLVQALDRNGNFFPARIALAQIAEQEGDWAQALDQLRTLAEKRTGTDTALNLATALRRSGPSGYAEAERVLVPLADKGSAVTLIELGRLYRAAGRNEAALQAFRDARSSDPHLADAAFELGNLLAYQGEALAAEKEFRAAIANDPSHTNAHLALGALYQEVLNRPGDAGKEYSAALDTGVADAVILTEIGDALIAAHQPSLAADAFSRALKLQPDNPWLFHGLARTYLDVGSFDEAIAAEQRTLDLIASRNDDDARLVRAEANTVLGDVERRRGRPDTAMQYYNQALTLDPVQSDAALGMGLVAVSQGNWAVALGHFEHAATMPTGRTTANAHFWLGEARLRATNFEGALDSYKSALLLQPNFPEALLGQAQTQAAIGQQEASQAQTQAARERHDAARQSVEQALRLRPRYAEALLFQGKLLQEDGDLRGALSAYTNSIKANDRIPETYYRRGILAMQDEKYDQAIADLRQATAMQPNFPDAFYWFGRASYAQNQRTQALAALKQAVALAGGNYPEARYYQGQVEQALDQRDAAIASYQAVIQTDATGTWGKSALDALAKLQQ